jgi:excisionase family DNA binding protein
MNKNGNKTNNEPIGKLLTTKEAAEAWGISRWSIYDLVKQGKIRPIVGFKSWRFTGRELQEVLVRL